MATNTGGGTTASLSNTPQAKDDIFNLLEDANSVAWFDVMTNDLGGNAKILWSLDDSATDAAGANDLIGSDIGKVEATTADTSAYGAKIWIQDGKVGYDAATLSASFKAALQALGVGQTLSDSFTYAIRLANGTLSWATAQVVFTGTNDGPDISLGTGDSASANLTETNAALSTNGTLTVVDPDTIDTVAVSVSNFSKSGNAGSLTDVQLNAMLALTESSLNANPGDAHNLHWSFNSTPQTFDYLAAGESLTLTYTVKADDGHGGVDTQTVTIKIDGTNDGPAIVAGGTLNGGVEEESGVYTATGSFGFTDVDSSDTHSVSVTPGGMGYLGTLTPSVSDDSTNDGAGTVSWSFSVANSALQFLGEGETRTQNYTITVDDGHGGTTTQTVQIVLTGDEDPVVITSAAQSQSISEDGTNVGGTISFNDVDLSDTHTASAAAHPGNPTSLGSFTIDPSVTEAANAANGSLGWSYTVDNAAAQYLATGETAVEKYDVTFNDGHGGTVTETVTVTITGSNDGPDIRAEAGDSAGHAFDETNAGLSTSGTLTVTDPDTSDTVDTSASLAVSGNQGPLSDGDLLAMFHITSGANDLAADSGDSHNLAWSFDSVSEAFDFLAQDQVLTLTYTLTSDDGHGGTDSQDVTITITGTNDTPELSASVTDHTYVDTAADDSFGNLTGTLSTVDPDSGDTATYSVDGGAADNSLAGYDISAASAYGTLYLNSTSGAYAFVPNDAAIEALKTDDSVGFTLNVSDSHGASDSATLTINLDGANDTPELSATLTTATFTDTAGDDSFSPVNGDLSSTDRDSPETATYGVLGGVSDNSLAGYDTAKATAFGTLYVDSASGNYTFVPDDAAIQGLKTNASLFFTLKVTDGSGASDSETLTINLNGVNDTPELGAVTDAHYDDTASDDSFGDVTGTLTSTDRDASETATYSVVGGVASAELGFDVEASSAYGTLYLNSLTGDYKFVPNDGAIEGLKATDTVDFNLTVTDGSGASDSDTLTITLNGVNDTPELNTVTDAHYDDTSADDSFGDVTGTLTSSDRDSGDSASYSVDGASATAESGFDQEVVTAFGTLYLDSATGNYKFVPDDAEIEGLKTTDHVDFNLTVTDGSGATDSDTLTITLNGVNDTPELGAVTDAHYDDTSADDSFGNVSGTLTSTDRDSGDSASYSVDGASATAEAGFDQEVASAYGTLYLDSASGAYKFVPNDAAIEGLKTTDHVDFNVSVTDGSGASDGDTLTITLNGVNDTPELGAVTDAHYDDTSADDSFGDVTGTLTSSDRDSGDSASYSVDGASATAEPGFDQEVASAYGTLYLNSLTGDYKFVPDDAAIEGLKTTDHVDFNVSVTDGSGATDSDTLTITLNGVNDTPEAPPTNSVTTDEDEASAAVAIDASDRDAGETLTYSVKAGEDASIGSVSFDQGAGTFTYTPDPDANGPDSFTILITDASGATTEQVVSVTVNPVNDAPVSGGPSSASGTEDDALISSNVPAASDVDGDSLTYHLVAGSVLIDGNPALDGTVTVNANGSYSYAPTAGDQGLDDGESHVITFDYVANDGTVNSAAAGVTITVHGADDAPTLAAVTAGSIAEVDQSSSTTSAGLSGTLVGADVDGETLTYGVVGGTVSAGVSTLVNAYGTLTVNTTSGAYLFTPNAGAIEGLDMGENPVLNFTMTVSDGDAPLGTQTYTINLIGADDTPTLAAVTSGSIAEINQSSSTTSSGLSGTLAGSDVDGETLTYGVVGGTVSAGVSTLVNTYGTLTVNTASGAYNFTPNAGAIEGLDVGENPSVNFTMTVSDGDAPLGTQIYTINLTGADDTPTLAPVTSGSIAEVLNSSSTTSSGLSGTLVGSDVDGETLSYGISGGSASGVNLVSLAGSYGTLTVNTVSGAYTYAPNSPAIEALNAGQTPSDVFTMTVSDGDAPLGTQTYTVNLTGANDAAVITGAISGSITEDDVPNTVGGNLNSTDVDNANDSWNAVASATASANGYGTYTMDAAGNWVYALNNANPTVNALNNGGTLSDSFTVTTADGTAQVVNITINGHTDVVGVTLPPTFNGTGDPNDFDNAGGAPAASPVTFNGGGGTDTVDGSNSADTLNGGGGDDHLFGHGGNDTINGMNGGDTQLYGQAGDDTITGGSGQDTIYGGSGNDTLYGNEPPPSNETGDTQDVIYGGSGNDTIYGQGNADTIIGGYGADLLSGGGGNDTFIYLDLKDTNDTISDFTSGDKIDFSAIDANPVLAGDQGFAFGGTTATAHGVWYAQVGGNAVVYVDTDGDAATAELSVTLTGVTTVSSGDFLLGP